MAVKITKQLVRQIEDTFFDFTFLYTARVRQSIRKKPGYKLQLKRILYLVSKLGLDKAKEVEDAMSKYQSIFYGRMNKSLRSGKIPVNSSKIDQYISAAPKFKGKELYRGIGKELFQQILNSKNRIFVDKAFISATSDIETAEWFATRKAKGAVLYLTGNVKIAAEAPGDEEASVRDLQYAECEYIFPRNTRIKITKIDNNKIYATVL